MELVPYQFWAQSHERLCQRKLSLHRIPEFLNIAEFYQRILLRKFGDIQWFWHLRYSISKGNAYFEKIKNSSLDNAWNYCRTNFELNPADSDTQKWSYKKINHTPPTVRFLDSKVYDKKKQSRPHVIHFVICRSHFIFWNKMWTQKEKNV